MMDRLPPKPANATFEVRVQGKPPVSSNQLIEAQWTARAAAEAGLDAEIIDGVTGQVIERHPARTA
jgi:hypothetical protein